MSSATNVSKAPITLSSLTYVQPANLATIVADASESSKVAIIDVRDSDHIGGHIRGSIWVPTDQLDVRMPELLRTLEGKEKVVFHCMLSQERGPRSALKYARAKAARDAKQDGDEQGKKQEVCVLEGGFGQWQARYGEDTRLTENYQKDLW